MVDNNELANPEKKLKYKYSSNKQNIHLFNFVLQNPSAIFFTLRTKGESDKMWLKVTNELNDLGPITRTVANWKKIWSDFKSRLKINYLKNRDSGKPNKLNELQRRVMKMLLANNDIDLRPPQKIVKVDETPALSTTNSLLKLDIEQLNPRNKREWHQKCTSKKQKRLKKYETEEFQQATEIFGQLVSAKLRCMLPKQKILAEKLISEVMYLSQIYQISGNK